MGNGDRRAASASGELFALLGVRAALGRTLGPEDDEPAAENAAVLTDGLWRRLFGGSRAALITLASTLGLAGAWLGAGWLQSMLFGVAPRDPGTFAGVAVLMALVAGTAVWLPARNLRRVEWAEAIGE